MVNLGQEIRPEEQERIERLVRFEIQDSDIQKLVNSLVDDELSPKFIKGIIGVLSDMLEIATNNDLIVKNPVKAVTLPKPDDVERRVLTAGEQNTLPGSRCAALRTLCSPRRKALRTKRETFAVSSTALSRKSIERKRPWLKRSGANPSWWHTFTPTPSVTASLQGQSRTICRRKLCKKSWVTQNWNSRWTFMSTSPTRR